MPSTTEFTAPVPTTKRSAERHDFLCDVLTTALEGGIGYWSVAEKYRWFSPTLEGGSADPLEIDGKPVQNAWAVISDTEGGEPDFQHVVVSVETIATGIARILDRKGAHPKCSVRDDLYRSVLAGSVENDAGEIDADGADCIVQAGLFDQIVYG